MLMRKGPQIRVAINPRTSDVNITGDDDFKPLPLQPATFHLQKPMNLKLPIMSVALDFSRRGVFLRVIRAVDCVDVENRKPRHAQACLRLDDRESPLCIPVDGSHALDERMQEVLAHDAADSIDFPTEAGCVVLVGGQAEMRHIVGIGRCFACTSLDGSRDGGLGGRVGGIDLDLLQEEDDWEAVPAEKLSKRGMWEFRTGCA